MYLNLLKKWFGGLWGGMFPRGLRRSPMLPIGIVLLVIVLPLVAWRLHRLGRFSTLKREIKGETQGQQNAGGRPGGLEPIVLQRTQTPGSNLPEFRSVTLLPGLGMQVLQITASIPGRGADGAEVSLLDAPTLKDLADGTTSPRVGPNDRWGALEVPWGGMLSGILAPLGTTVRTTWRGKNIEAPTDSPARGVAEGGMLATLSADMSQALPESAPTQAVATFKGTDFDQHWVSRNDVSISARMDASAIELTVTVKNTGDTAEPMGIGWHPRFLIPSGNRDGAELRLPSGAELDIADRVKGTPSGKIIAPTGAVERFQVHPTALGTESFDESLVHLKAGTLDNAVMAEVRDPESAFGIRMSALSDDVRELRVASPGGSKYVSLGMQTNYDDPLGKEWNAVEPPSITVLQPGQTAQWKIRLEIFPISSHSSAR